MTIAFLVPIAWVPILLAVAVVVRLVDLYIRRRPPKVHPNQEQRLLVKNTDRSVDAVVEALRSQLQVDSVTTEGDRHQISFMSTATRCRVYPSPGGSWTVIELFKPEAAATNGSAPFGDDHLRDIVNQIARVV